MTNREVIASLISKAEHWERKARQDSAVAAVCLDYAVHIRVLAELVRLEELDVIV